MLKNIPKSNVSNRQFKVYKRFAATHADYPVLKIYDKSSVYHTGSGQFDSSSFDRTISGSINDSFHKYPMYQSIKHKYFTDNGLINMFGMVTDMGDFSNERRIDETLFLIPITQSRVGEGIKPGSVKLYSDQLNSGSLIYDDGFGNLVGERKKYQFLDADFGSFGTGSLSNNGDLDKGVYLKVSDTLVTESIKLSYGLDLMNPTMTLTLEGDTDIHTLERWDMFTNDIGGEYISGSSDIRTQGTIHFTEPLNFLGSPLKPLQYGNVLYQDGLIAITTHDVHNDVSLEDVTTYDLQYRSTKTLNELEVLCSVKDCEFNYSQNPSAVNVTLSGSYDFETTEIFNVRPGGARKIKEVLDITQVNGFTSSYDGITTGSWDDYYSKTITDPTGSYLTTFVSTIGLYDDNNNMVAVAKLPKPIKNYPDMALNFIVRIDL
jgi:hypothetical protein